MEDSRGVTTKAESTYKTLEAGLCDHTVITRVGKWRGDALARDVQADLMKPAL